MLATNCERDSEGPPVHDTATNARVWVLRDHRRLTLRQAHAIVAVDHAEGVARAACGLALGPTEIGDIPSGGCMPCAACLASTAVAA